MENITNEVESKEIELSSAQQSFKKKMLNGFLFRMFLLSKIPLGFVAGMRLTKLTTQSCETTIPYGWLTQNPFRSIYFAAMNMGAEMSTGALTSMAIFGKKPSISMLITGLESTFTKKANKTVTFTCDEGQKVFDTVQECIETGEPKTIKVKTVGRMKDGTEVATFYFTWSIKQRS